MSIIRKAPPNIDPKSREPTEDYQRQLEEAKLAADFLSRVFNEISDSVLIIDPQSYRILTFNQSALNNLELNEAQLLGTTCHQLFYQRPTPCETFYKTCPIKEILNTPQHIVIEYEYTNKNNKLRYFEISASPIKDKNGAIRQIAFMLRNITRKKRASQQENNIPEVDKVSKLYNENTFYKHLKREISRSRRHQRPLSLAIISIDNQDIYGKLSLLDQREFLVKTGKIISDNIRSVDRVYRYGEYGFAVILPETEGSQAVIFAQRLKQDYQDVLKGYGDINKVVIYSMFTLSTGIAPYCATDDVETLVKKAEAALQQAQCEGDSIHLWNA